MTGLTAIPAHLLCTHHPHIAFFLCLTGFGMNLLIKHCNGGGAKSKNGDCIYFHFFFTFKFAARLWCRVWCVSVFSLGVGVLTELGLGGVLSSFEIIFLTSPACLFMYVQVIFFQGFFVVVNLNFFPHFDPGLKL